VSRWCLRAGVVLLVLGTAQGVALLAGLGGDAAAHEDRSALVERGRKLFLDSCASCHGEDARGIAGRAPTLHGAGAAAADWYVTTGRMPLTDPHDEPLRGEPAYSPRDIAALVAYAGTLGGPPVPDVDPARGDVGEGRELFSEHCAGCHQIVGKGGALTGALVPKLDEATPVQVGEAIRIGPYLMPSWDEGVISDADVDDLAAYVEHTQALEDPGGWGIGHTGPVPEGLISILLAGGVLVVISRVIGERAPR
jgi:ubiquinol-cytochrome c reductase cytochrome c subunit